MKQARPSQHGFTLIELLVALVVFAILSVMAYSGLNVVLEARDRMERQTGYLTELQMSFTLIGRDIEQAVNRPIRDEFGDSIGAMRGDDANLEFTRAGWRNPAGLPRSELQRVAYLVDDGELRRVTWTILDRTQASEVFETALLGDVEAVALRYLMQDGEWLPFWPPAGDNPLSQEALPRAIEVTLETEQWGPITRLFRTPGVVVIGTPPVEAEP